MRILNLGAGVQSTTVYLLAMEGLIDSFDCAIFADTQEEPKAVYKHLDWLVGLNGPKILIRTRGKLGDDLVAGTNSAGNRKKKESERDGSTRFASIPAYTAPHHDRRAELTGCSKGMVRRQCTSEYKIEVVERAIRREVLKVGARKRVPKGIRVQQVFGISADERFRANRIRARLKEG